MSKLVDKHAHIKTDLDAILSGKKVMESTCVKAKQVPNKLVETITSEADLLSKLRPLSSADIYSFMSSLHNGTFFNMGTYKEVPLARAYKKSYNIYRVLNSTAIVTGSGYENLGTTKDYRAATGAAPASAWYEHEPGYENKIGRGKRNPNNKYILWNAKKTSGSWVAFYLVDLDTRAVTPISGESILHSDYITNTEKKNLGLLGEDEEITGWDPEARKFIITKKADYTPKPVSNETIWRTSKFENVFWLSQKDREYGAKFEESFTGSGAELEEGVANGVRDLHAGIHTDLDAILSGSVDESLNEDYDKPIKVKTVSLPSHGRKIELNICIYKDEREYDYDDGEENYEIGVNGFVNNEEFMLDSEKLSSLIKSGYTYLTHMLKEDAEETLEKLYSYFSNIEYADVNNTLLELCDEYSFDLLNSLNEEVKNRSVRESYRRTVSRGKEFIDNELFVDFD